MYLSPQSSINSGAGRLRLKSIGPAIAIVMGLSIWALFAYALWRLLA
jgi:hypothetical protein